MLRYCVACRAHNSPSAMPSYLYDVVCSKHPYSWHVRSRSWSVCTPYSVQARASLESQIRSKGYCNISPQSQLACSATNEIAVSTVPGSNSSTRVDRSDYHIAMPANGFYLFFDKLTRPGTDRRGRSFKDPPEQGHQLLVCSHVAVLHDNEAAIDFGSSRLVKPPVCRRTNVRPFWACSHLRHYSYVVVVHMRRQLGDPRETPSRGTIPTSHEHATQSYRWSGTASGSGCSLRCLMARAPVVLRHACIIVLHPANPRSSNREAPGPDRLEE
jgi:hypothetical protein